MNFSDTFFNNQSDHYGFNNRSKLIDLDMSDQFDLKNTSDLFDLKNSGDMLRLNNTDDSFDLNFPNISYNYGFGNLTEDYGISNLSLESQDYSDQINFSLPSDMVFGEANVYSIISYSILLVIGVISNSVSLYQLVRERFYRKNRSRMILLLLHLTIADLSVIMFAIPLEIGWSATVSWEADEITCKLVVFLKMYGFLISSFILIVISIDRFVAVLYPFYHLTSSRRTKYMLLLSYITAICCSIPQIFVFEVQTHPIVAWYKQCMTTLQGTEEMLYFLYFFVLSWCLPVLVMGVCYSSIAVSIYRRADRTALSHTFRSKSRDSDDETPAPPRQCLLGKAKIKSVKLTGILTFGFVLCWTPYQIANIWYFIDQESFFKLDFRIQKFLWVFCCVNNCVNPFLYNMFSYNSSVHCSRKQSRSGHEAQDSETRPGIELQETPFLQKDRFVGSKVSRSLLINSRRNRASINSRISFSSTKM